MTAQDLPARLRAMAGPIEPNVCTEAADEIERLGAERKEAQIAFLAAHMDLLGRFETMRNERDEARREICKTVVFPSSPTIYAAQRGWDCYRDVQP